MSDPIVEHPYVMSAGDVDHFHTTGSVIYVSCLHPGDGSLKLRAYIVAFGGVLEEYDYTARRLLRSPSSESCPCGYRDPDLAPSVHDPMHPQCRERSDA